MTGGRDYQDYDTVVRVLSGYFITELCHGGATGADSLADKYARKVLRITPVSYPAYWSGPCSAKCPPGHRKVGAGGEYCPLAGHRRNQLMLDEFKPDLVLAFPGGTGTQDMCKRAAAAGVRVDIGG